MIQLETPDLTRPRALFFKRALKGFVWVLSLFIVLIIASFIYIYVKTGESGYENKYVTSWLEQKLQKEIPKPYSLKVDTTRFVRGQGLSLSLLATNVTVHDDTFNKDILTAKSIKLGFDMERKVTLLAAKSLFLTKIDIQDLSASIQKTNKDEVDFSALPPIFAAVQHAGDIGFSTLKFTNTQIILNEGDNNRVLPPHDVILQEGRNKNWDFSLAKHGEKAFVTASLSPTNAGLALEAVLPAQSIKEFAALLSLKLDEKLFQGIAQGKVNALFNAQGEPTAFKSTLLLTNAKLAKGGKHPKTYLIPQAKIALSWVEGRDVMNLDALELDMRPWNAALQGIISKPVNGEYPFIITQGKIDVYDDTPSSMPVELNKIALKGTIAPSLNEIKIEQAQLEGPQAAIEFNAKLKLADSSPALDLDLKSSAMPVQVFTRLWPEMVSTNSRLWIIDRIKSGIVEPATIKTALPIGVLAPDNIVLRKEMLEIKAVIRDAVIKPLEALPAIKTPRADIYLDGTRILATAPKGTMQYDKHEPFVLNSLTFEIPDTAPEILQGSVLAKANCTAEALIDLLKIDMFKGVSAFAFDEGGAVKGNAAMNITLNLPLRADVTKKEVNYKAEIDFTHFTQQEVMRDFALEQGTIKVLASSNDFRMQGEGLVAGTKASFDYKKQVSSKKPLFTVNTTLDDKGRARLGFETGGKITGRTPIKLTSEGEESGIYKIEADLTAAKMNELIPGWIKPAGQAAKAKLTAIEKDLGWKIEDLVLEGRGVLIKGAAEFDQHGGLINGSFPSYHLSDGDKASVRIEKIQNGYKVSLIAALIDIRAPMKNLLSSSSGSPDKGVLQIDAKVNIASGYSGEVLRGVTLKATRINGEIRAIEGKGRNGQGDFNIGFIKENEKPFITIATADAGSWLRFLDIYKGLYGGSLRLAVSPPKGDGSIEAGSLEIKNFNVKDGAFSSLAASSGVRDERKNLSLQERQKILQETARQANHPTNTQFTRMKANFSKTSSQVLHISEGLIWGPALGSTIEGSLDFKQNKISLSGTYVPIYALNNMFAKIPLLGLFLGGGQDEGLIGVSYDIKGSATSPELIINPLSAIAPGFLRKIVEFKGRSTPNEPPIQQ